MDKLDKKDIHLLRDLAAAGAPSNLEARTRTWYELREVQGSVAGKKQRVESHGVA